MRVKSITLLAATTTLVAGISFFSMQKGPLVRPQIAWEDSEAEEEEEGEERGIQGALESVYFMRLNEKTQTIEPEWVKAAVEQADKARLNRRASSLVWQNLGPDNIGGRIRAFLLHKDSLNIMFASGVSGGLWRSNTAGQSWKQVNDMQENLNVTCIAQTSDGTIYYGTGEGGYTNLSGTRNGSPAFLGNGVYKSTGNRGLQFTLLNSTKNGNFDACNMMVAHPTDGRLWVATENGLFVTSNGGTTFQTSKSGSFRDLAIDPNGVVWAVNATGIIYKTDAAGTTWSSALNTTGSGFQPSNGRTSIAISPQDGNTVYAMASSGGALAGVYKTSDGGQTWKKIISAGTITDVFGPNKQGWYDNVIAVDPQDKNKIYMGGVVLATYDDVNQFREIANTANLNWNTGYVHADKHVIQFDTRAGQNWMIVGTDGGLFFSQDRQTWTPRNRGLTTLQLYNVAANRNGYVVGGAQDNGTNLINFSGNAINNDLSKTAIEVYGGDGFDAEFSRVSPRTMFVSTYYGRVARSGNLGQSSSTFWDKRIKTDDNAADPPKTDFNTTFALWENEVDSSSILFLARDAEVWAAINPTDFANPVNWFRVAAGMGNDRIIEMDVTPDGDHLFICKSGRIYRIDNIQSANFDVNVYPGVNDIPSPINKVDITPGILTSRVVTSVNVDQSDANHLVVTLGGYGNSTYIYETKNALASNPTFTNITGDFPSMPAYDAVVDTHDPKHIIMGTDLGIWETTNGGTNWVEANNGMARVPVFEIRGYEYKPWEGMQLYIGTHGRGYYRSYSLVTGTKQVKKSEGSLQAYPSPASSIVNLVFTAVKATSASVDVYGMDGKQYLHTSYEMRTGENQLPLNISSLTNGYYFARITAAGKVETVKFMVGK